MPESLLDNEFLQRLEYLYIVVRGLFSGRVSAERLSKKFGIGLEFADFRSYTAGDDFRYVDWATYARREQLFIKLFTEEQTTNLYFVIDASKSMSLGQPEKLLFAKKIVAALGYVGLANLDPVTVVAFDSKMRPGGRSFQGRGQSRYLMEHLEGLKAQGDGTSMGVAVRDFVQRYSGRGLVVLLSDFLDRDGYKDALRLVRYHHHHLLAIQINDREEVEPSFTGDLELVDSESGARVVLKTTPDLVEGYRRRREDHYAELARLCKLVGWPYMQAVTDMPFEELIFNVFRKGGLLR